MHFDPQDNGSTVIMWGDRLDPAHFCDTACLARPAAVFVLADHLVAMETAHGSGCWLRSPTVRHGTLRIPGEQAPGRFSMGCAFVNNSRIAAAYRNNQQELPPLNWSR